MKNRNFDVKNSSLIKSIWRNTYSKLSAFHKILINPSRRIFSEIFLFNSLTEIRGRIQEVIGNKTNINIGPAAENYGGETFLAEEVAISFLQETKLAFKRCQMVCYDMICYVFDLLCKFW